MYLVLGRWMQGHARVKTPLPPERCVPGSYTVQLIIFTHETVGYLVL